MSGDYHVARPIDHGLRAVRRAMILSVLPLALLAACGNEQGSTDSQLVELRYDPENGCRNDATASVDGDEWQLVDLIPLEWREADSQLGEFVREGETSATFSSQGYSLELTLGAVSIECIRWDDA